MDTVASNLSRVREQIAAACLKAGRQPGDVRLIAVSKTKSAAQVREAVLAGQTDMGESYVQEFLEKHADPLLRDLPVSWHFIGHLQSNKVRAIIGKVVMIHGVDRFSTAREISGRALQHDLRIDYLLEVNVSHESTKFGIEPEMLMKTAEQCMSLPGIRLRGLMTIASPDTAKARKEFAELRGLLEKLRKNLPDPAGLTELSMGMSLDFREAILEGATMIRIGSAIFGMR
jgi:pyridoxal phosphate enzyme (YggS family)